MIIIDTCYDLVFGFQLNFIVIGQFTDIKKENQWKPYITG